MGAGEFRVTLDPHYYTAKPEGPEIGYITRRLQRAGGTSIDYEAFCEHVQRGGTWCPGVFEPCEGGWGEFVSMQVVALDFDNSAYVLDADGRPVKGAKRPLRQGEAGFLDPVDALDRCEQLKLWPVCIYFTFSAKAPDQPRYRLVFDLQEPVANQAVAQAVVGEVMAAFPECDQACSNLNRLFYGSNGEVWPCWEVVPS